MRNLNSPESFRNFGFWNEAVQDRIHEYTVGIAGNGGTGNMFGMELARMGFQHFYVADPEVFDQANSNRVFGVRTDTIGVNKAEGLKNDILAINPDAQVTTYTDGITPDNIEEFLHETDLVLNGTELTRPELGVMLSRAARSRKIGGEVVGIPMLDVEYIGHAGQGMVFDPTSKATFERVMGLDVPQDVPFDELAGAIGDQKVGPNRYLAYLPPYGDLKTLEAILNGAPLPSNMIGAGVAAQIGAAEVLKQVRLQVGERTTKIVPAPYVRWYDAYTGESGHTRHPQASFYKHLAGVLIRNKLNLNEPASYTPEERAARGDLD